MRIFINKAADVLLGGGVIAYPTEGVFGLGCLPDEHTAVLRILAIKQRDPSKGLILIAAEREQFAPWIAPADLEKLPPPDPECAITWVVQPAAHASRLLSGDNRGLAVRLCCHAVAAAICLAVDSPIISTSANISGRPVARNKTILRRQFQGLVDYIVPGDCGPGTGPSELRRLADGTVIRPRTA